MITPVEGGKPAPAASPSPSASRLGDVVAEKYRIDEALGEGGMGVVYRATNLFTQKRVALKCMLPRFAEDRDAVSRFLREARAAGRVDHPNIINIYDVGQHHGTPFLVMELLNGAPLSSALTKGALPPDLAVELLMPALRGVAAAHAIGVVHRDLKPDNVFLCTGPDGRVHQTKVLDFGISKAITEEELKPLTRTGALVGTPHYMSPEQVRGMKELDARVDVYALGVILYEALTGRLPFDAEHFAALAIKIATATPKPPRQIAPKIPAELEKIVLRAIAREREDRYPDVAGLARALEPFGRGAKFDDPSSSRPISLALAPADRTAETLPAGSPEEPTPATPPMGALKQAEDASLMETQLPSDATSSAEAPPRPTASARKWLVVAAVVLAAALGVAWIASTSGAPDDPVAAPPAVARPAPEPDPAPVGEPEAARPDPAAALPQAIDPPPEMVAPPAPEPSEPAPAPRRRAPRATPPAAKRAAPADTTTRTARGVRTGAISADEF